MSATMATPMLSPVSLTFMPEYLHRSPSSSSLNTRQRSDFEESQATPVASTPSSFSPNGTAMLVEGEGDDQVGGSDGEQHAAVEMPFASEPALEGELEQELPPLKKLKPSGAGEEGGVTSQIGVKGILARKVSGHSNGSAEGSAMDLEGAPSLESSGLLPPSHPPQRPTLASLTPLSLSTLGSDLGQSSNPSSSQLSSRPMSRRSSSGASSTASSALKAVRFASGNGFSSASSTSTPTAIWTSEDEHWSSSHEHSDGLIPPDKEDERVASPIEFEGPVAAVVYLTHSREAYDRSPIVVDDEGNLSLPPRERKIGERGWIRCGKKRAGAPKSPGPGGLVGAAGLDQEAKALRKQKEKLRQEIEALGRAGLVNEAGTGASPLLRNIGLSDRSPSEDTTQADRAPREHGATSAWTMQVTKSTSSLSTLRNEALDFEDPNIAVALPPADVDLADIVSEVGEENPGDALSDDGSVGSDGEGVQAESLEGDPEEDEDAQDDAGEDDDDDAPQDEDEEVAEDDEDEEDPEEEGERRRRRQMGMCGMGKWSRGDVFNTCDALGGF